jgi:hypothetical protein
LLKWTSLKEGLMQMYTLAKVPPKSQVCRYQSMPKPTYQAPLWSWSHQSLGLFCRSTSLWWDAEATVFWVSCIARSQVVWQDHKMYCKITSCIARSQVVLQGHKLYCKITSCIARSQVVLQDHKLNCKITSSLLQGWPYWVALGYIRCSQSIRKQMIELERHVMKHSLQINWVMTLSTEMIAKEKHLRW